MHELSLAHHILQMVEAACTREHVARASQLRLEVGALACVETSALRFALEAITPGTCLEGATLLIDEPEAQGFCAHCATHVPLTSRTDACPLCGGYPVLPTSGTELRITELLVQGEPSCA